MSIFLKQYVTYDIKYYTRNLKIPEVGGGTRHLAHHACAVHCSCRLYMWGPWHPHLNIPNAFYSWYAFLGITSGIRAKYVWFHVRCLGFHVHHISHPHVLWNDSVQIHAQLEIPYSLQNITAAKAVYSQGLWWVVCHCLPSSQSSNLEFGQGARDSSLTIRKGHTYLIPWDSQRAPTSAGTLDVQFNVHRKDGTHIDPSPFLQNTSVSLSLGRDSNPG